MRTVVLLACSALLAVNVFACKGSDSSPAPSASGGGTSPSPAGPVSLTGSGSTFVNPLMAKWIDQYKSIEKNASINYQSVGSGAGLKAIGDKTVDFGASDTAMTD